MDIINIDRDMRLCPVRVLALAHLLALSRSLAFFLRPVRAAFSYRILSLQNPSSKAKPEVAVP